MGFLTHTVGAVVNAVENATGQQNSDAGNAAEQTAADVEQHTEDAAGKASDGASDAAGVLTDLFGGAKDGTTGFVRSVGAHLGDGVGSWLVGAEGKTGVALPDRMDLASIFGLVRDVSTVVESNVEAKATNVFGDRPVGAVKAGAGVVGDAATGGPAAVWKDVKEALGGVKDHTAGGLRHWGSKVGASVGDSTPAKKIEHMFGNGPDNAAAVWAAIKGAVQDGKTRGAGGVESLAQRAEDEHQKMLAALRRALRAAESAPTTTFPAPPQPVPGFGRHYSRGVDGMELRRLMEALQLRIRRGKSGPSAETSRHLADAGKSAARAAVLHAELLTWLAALRRAARRMRAIAASRTKNSPHSPKTIAGHGRTK